MNQHMHVIRHHAPSEQFILFVMKMQHGLFSNFGGSRIAQMTLADTTVEILLQLCALFPVIFNLQQMFPFATT